MIKWLFTVFLLKSIFILNAQNLELSNLHFQNYSDTSIPSSHTQIKPYIGIAERLFEKKSLISSNKNISKWHFELNPIMLFNVGVDESKYLSNEMGLGFDLSISNSKWALFAKYLPYHIIPNTLRSEFIDNSLVDFGSSTFFKENNNQRLDFILAYQPNKFFNFSTGVSKHFFGEGYRSLLLSDNSAANPFLNITTEFGPIKYVNLYNVWSDFYGQNNGVIEKDIKLSAMHLLSWNIHEKFNFSIFETVVWQAKDTLSNRFFEPNYLNPFVFYRPVEYAQGSADNVLLGINMSYKPNRSSTIYYQLVLDEFLLSELKSRSRWWANKYGMQLGVKSKNLFVDGLFFQTEINFVRPFTYSHKQSLQAYGSANAFVAHPLGANFIELTGIVSYTYKRHQFTLKSNYFGIGKDVDSVSYGQNIFNSYTNRVGDKDHYLMQGEKHNVLNIEFLYDYKIKLIKNTFFTCKYRYRSDVSSQLKTTTHFVEIGIRTRMWNIYDDI